MWRSIFCQVNGGWPAKILWRKIIGIQPKTKLEPWLLLEFIYGRRCRFRTPMYRDCKSDDDLSCSKVLNASFFAQIASLISWLHQNVLFSLLPATLSRFCSQLSTADELIADLNCSHFFLMSFGCIGEVLELRWYTGCKFCPYFFIPKASHLIQ